ncbi:hypothetical protein LINGRAHAP2_LOCUS19919 [Linum grandiflorum]
MATKRATEGVPGVGKVVQKVLSSVSEQCGEYRIQFKCPETELRDQRGKDPLVCCLTFSASLQIMEGEATQQVNVVAAADQQPLPQPQQAEVQLAANQHPSQAPQQAENAQQVDNVEVVPLGNRRESEVWDHFDRIY